MTTNVVDRAWLEAHTSDPGLVLLDVRPEAGYLDGHLPGARHYDPMPFALQSSEPDAVDRFIAQHQWLFSTLGIGADSQVLIYEERFDTRAARTAWTLEFLGHEAISILEADLDELQTLLTPRIEPATSARFQARPRPELLATAREILQGRDELIVVDTRKQIEYLGLAAARGRSGRIPGAIHRDYADNLAAPGRLKRPDRLRDELTASGIQQDARIVTYCGGGGRASHAYYALRSAGFTNIAVYQPSWSEWGRRSELPVEGDRRIA